MAIISIHVPTRGTTASSRKRSACLYFNPRAHEGHDDNRGNHAALKHFNPRAHEGHDAADFPALQEVEISIHVPTRGTTQTEGTYILKRYFNPRAHEGHDSPDAIVIVFRGISIHVPTRGTTASVAGSCWITEFQSTCPRGARLRLAGIILRCCRISIHVPTRGTTLKNIYV